MARPHSVLIAAMVAAALVLLVPVAGARGKPQVEVSPQQGPQGTVVTVTGQGFLSGDTIFVELYRAPGNGDSIRLATVSADSAGEFDFRVAIDIDSGVLIPGEYLIMGYPRSFGDRTAETIEQAPKVSFTLTGPAAPPSAGGQPPVVGGSGFTWGLVGFGGVLILAAAAAMLLRQRA